jgi:hypothetical protein
MLPCFPNRIEDHDAVDGRMNLHQRRVCLGMQHRLPRTVALNFKNANRSLRRLAFQVERLF